MKFVPLPYSDPYSVFLSLISKGYPVTLFLDSASLNEKTGRFSFIALGILEELRLKNDKDSLEKLRKFYEKLKSRYGDITEVPYGVFGFLSYDLNRFIEPKLSINQLDDLDWPDLLFFLPETLLVFDNLLKKVYLVTCSNFSLPSFTSFIKGSFAYAFLGFNMEKDYFISSVKRIKEYIKTGDTFQVNFSQRLDFEVRGDLFYLYHILRAVNPSPFSFYMDFGDLKAVSCSPERLILKAGEILETRPIAGTRRRGKNLEEDKLLERELILSEKERAEHIMLVDLERNDLGKVCRYGTVKVDELMVREKYSHVIHIVSNVKGTLREGVDEVEVLKALFPGGTITGAPKVRTMEIIGELEPTCRGLYTGSVGYIGFNGKMDFNIVIRTLLVKEERGFLQVGAGIVWDSDPLREYEETLHKAKAILEALRTAQDSSS